MRTTRSLLLALTLCATQSLPALGAAELTGQIAAELRYFPGSAALPDQSDQAGGLMLAPEFYLDAANGDLALPISPFFRWDAADEDRSHFDLREAYLRRYGSNWELTLGLGRVFWGLTESNHLVDVVNQTDLVENPDGEDKLGQPMIALGLFPEWGDLELFLLPGFHERNFPGQEGRLRAPLPIGEARYANGDEERHVDWALRWSRSLGSWDLGLSHFHGTAREPRMQYDDTGANGPELRPFYDQMDQTGLELQTIAGGWIWKLEAIRRDWTGDSFIAAVGGFEYTLVGLGESAWDLGLITEYSYDGRDPNGSSLLDDDVFFGGRFVANDVQSTELLLGGITDLSTRATLLSAEFSRRLGSRWRLVVESRIFLHVEEDPILVAFDRDDYFQVELARFF